MAKKKKYVSNKTASEDTMVSKVEIKKPQDQDKVSRLVGTIFIILGFLFVGYGIYSFVKYSKTPVLDESLQAPFLSGTDELVNEDNIVIKGIATDYTEVFVYVDGNEVGRTDVKDDDSFEYTYTTAGEGNYSVTVAGVKGFPKRYISPLSDARVIVVDKTQPELASILYSPEVGTETFSMTGEVESGCKILLKRGTASYSSDCGEDGKFSLTGIALDEGPNVFTMVIEDKAGNVKTVDDKVRVTYSADSDVNGDAVTDVNGDGITDESLPVAAGDLDTALGILSDNNLMMIFGIISISMFVLSSGVVVLKRNGKKE